MLIRGVSRISVDFFGLIVLKNFVGNAFNLPEFFGYRNFLSMRTENHVLQSKIFVSQYAKNSWEPLLSFRILGISETFLRITVFLLIFWSHSTEKFREEPSIVSKIFNCEVSKKKLNKNGISRFSFENFSAQSAERFRCGTLRYIRKVRLSKSFMPKRVISLFAVEFFVTYTAYKDRQGIHLCFRIFWISKTFMLISGVSRFSFDNFGLTVLKNFVRNPFKLPEIFEYRFFLCIRTENHVLHSKFFVSQYAKNSWERLLRFKMFRISETFFAYHGFPSIFLAHSSEKLREEPSNVSESFK